MTLERAIGCGRGEELVEVTPKVIRIRKRYLDTYERKRASRKAEAAWASGREGRSRKEKRETI